MSDLVVRLGSDPLPTVRIWEEGTAHWELVNFVDRCESLKFAPTHLDLGSWSLMTDYDDEQATDLGRDRLVSIDMREHRSTWGIVPSPSSDGESGRPLLEVTGVGAFARLGWEEAWPDPALGINAQPVVNDNEPAPYKGPAETVIKRIVQENLVTRYGMKLVVPPSRGRGSVVTARPKFDRLSDLIPKLAKVGGIGVDIGLVNVGGPDSTRADLTLLVWEPEDLTKDILLTAAAGTIASWKQPETEPTLTKAIVNGAGPGGVNRVRRIVTTPASEAAAVAWGGHRVGSVDGPSSFDPDEIDQAGKEAILAGSSTRTLELTSAESEGLQAFTEGFVPGVKATGQPVTGALVEDVITSIPVEISVEGITVGAVFGDPSATDADADIADSINAAQAAIRRLQRK